MEFLAGILIGLAVVGGVGYLIGSVKGNGADGLLWSLLLGPIGWVIVLCMADSRAKCPLCGGRLEDAKFKRCKHCGGELGRNRPAAPVMIDPLEQWEAKERAKTLLEVPEHLRGRKLDD